MPYRFNWTFREALKDYLLLDFWDLFGLEDFRVECKLALEGNVFNPTVVIVPVHPLELFTN